MGEFKERAYRGQLRQGFWLPFFLLAGGIYLFINALVDKPSSYNNVEGELKCYKVTDAMYLNIKGDSKKYKLVNRKGKKKLKSYLPDNLSCYYKLKTNKTNKTDTIGNYLVELKASDNNIIVALRINGKQFVEKQKRWKMFIIPSIFIIISLIFIPKVIKERRKHAKYFGDDRLFGRRYEEDEE